LNIIGNSDYSQPEQYPWFVFSIGERATNSEMKGGEQHGTKRGMRIEKAVW
jgi:hypothetical protein